jgi:hypothetical protein
MELNMNKTFAMLATAAVIGLAMTAGHAAEAPLAPQVNFVATPASQLQLGMTADDVIRIVGKAARQTDVTIGATQTRKLEFTSAIPGQVILEDGKVSRVKLDAFRLQTDALPIFLRQAWPGLASSAVRCVLGEPSTVLHHKFFDIEVDQWIFSRAGDIEVSVFFRADRVVAKAAGRDVPTDLFRVDLPSPPDTEGQGPTLAPRLGMTTGEIGELYGAPLYRLEYVFNGQPASHVVYKASEKGTFVGLSFVDGVVTELEDLERMPEDPAFQGR